MAANEQLLNLIREALMALPDVEEKRMFGGTCFMVDDKLCICDNKNEMLCRIDPADFTAAVEMDGVRPMKMGDRSSIGYVYVHEDVINQRKDFEFWVNKALAFNKIAIRPPRARNSKGSEHR